MPRKRDLGTRRCCAEYRAWFAFYLQRFRNRSRIKEAFNEQFPENKIDRSFSLHMGLVQRCGADVQSQLLDLAKGFSW